MSTRLAELVAAVEADPCNAYNVDRFKVPTRPCRVCREPFDPDVDYEGGVARGKPRLYCSRRCRDVAGALRRLLEDHCRPLQRSRRRMDPNQHELLHQLEEIGELANEISLAATRQTLALLDRIEDRFLALLEHVIPDVPGE